MSSLFFSNLFLPFNSFRSLMHSAHLSGYLKEAVMVTRLERWNSVSLSPHRTFGPCLLAFLRSIFPSKAQRFWKKGYKSDFGSPSALCSSPLPFAHSSFSHRSEATGNGIRIYGHFHQRVVNPYIAQQVSIFHDCSVGERYHHDKWIGKILTCNLSFSFPVNSQSPRFF